jgi:hypothetical protein
MYVMIILIIIVLQMNFDICQSWNEDSIRMAAFNKPTSLRYAEHVHVVHCGSRSFSHIHFHML